MLQPGADGKACLSMSGDDKHDDRPATTATASSYQSRRRRRCVQLGIACLLTAIFVGIVLWSRGFFEDPSRRQVLTIAPEALFEQLCDEVHELQLNKLHVSQFSVDDQLVSKIGHLDSIETLILDEGVVTDESIETIAGLPRLQHLRLRLSPISDRGLKLLSEAESLWYLNLPHAECTSEGIAALANLPRLRQLRLGSPNLSNEVTREIAKLDSLRGIHLIGVAVTDEGLKTLAAMPHLESIYLDDSAVTEAGWDWLFEEYPHLHVHIDQAHHDRDPKAHRHH